MVKGMISTECKWKSSGDVSVGRQRYLETVRTATCELLTSPRSVAYRKKLSSLHHKLSNIEVGFQTEVKDQSSN